MLPTREELDATARGLSDSLERHRNRDGLISVARDSEQRAWAMLDVARVSQLDANLLDEELIKLGREAVERVCKLFDLQSRGAELDLALRVAVWWFYTRVNLPTPGQALQNLRYRNESVFTKQWSTRGLLSLRNDLPTRVQRVGLLLLSICLPFAFAKFRERFEMSQDAREQELGEHLATLHRALHLARLINFILFLRDGRYRTLQDRVLTLRLVPIRNECVRSVSFDLMNQQLLFDGFTQFILVILPLVDWNSIWRGAVRAKNFAVSLLPQRDTSMEQQQEQERGICAYCQNRPVMPHRVQPCGHVYCYFCIKSLSYSNSPSCCACEQTMTSVERL